MSNQAMEHKLKVFKKALQHTFANHDKWKEALQALLQRRFGWFDLIEVESVCRTCGLPGHERRSNRLCPYYQQSARNAQRQQQYRKDHPVQFLQRDVPGGASAPASAPMIHRVIPPDSPSVDASDSTAPPTSSIEISSPSTPVPPDYPSVDASNSTAPPLPSPSTSSPSPLTPVSTSSSSCSSSTPAENIRIIPLVPGSGNVGNITITPFLDLSRDSGNNPVELEFSRERTNNRMNATCFLIPGSGGNTLDERSFMAFLRDAIPPPEEPQALNLPGPRAFVRMRLSEEDAVARLRTRQNSRMNM